MPEANDSRRRVPPRIIVGAVAALVLLLLVIVSAVGSSPGACSSCHAMKPFADALVKSPHGGVSCYACHLDDGWVSWPSFKTRELVGMYPAAVIGRGVSGPSDGIARGRCLACHQSVLDGPVTSKGTRIDHAACAKGSSCDTCHGATAHGTTTRWVRQPFMDDCVRCHLKNDAPVRCDTCHADKSTADRIAAGPWQVTHGPNWRTTHGMGDIALCSMCHASTKCVQCHGMALPHPADFGRTHGTAALTLSAKCLECHSRERFCDACHGSPMPHPADFLPTHSKIAKSRQDEACLKCHYQSDCNACHVAHTHPGTTAGTLQGKTLPGVKK
ncbi:MAG TPA: hypothetical protein VF902_04515 [Coriobacteriia bacterium]